MATEITGCSRWINGQQSRDELRDRDIYTGVIKVILMHTFWFFRCQTTVKWILKQTQSSYFEISIAVDVKGWRKCLYVTALKMETDLSSNLIDEHDTVIMKLLYNHVTHCGLPRSSSSRNSCQWRPPFSVKAELQYLKMRRIRHPAESRRESPRIESGACPLTLPRKAFFQSFIYIVSTKLLTRQVPDLTF